MIGALRGSPSIIDKNTALIFAGGVGYEVRITSEDAKELMQHEEVLMHVVFCLRQEKIEMFAFLKSSDKELFNIFSNINGVGGKTALAMIDAKELVSSAIRQESSVILAQIPGIGKKTAEKLLVELRNNKRLILPDSCVDHKSMTEAISVLVNLGINRTVASQAVQQVLQIDSNLSLEDLVKKSLSMARSHVGG